MDESQERIQEPQIPRMVQIKCNDEFGYTIETKVMGVSLDVTEIVINMDGYSSYYIPTFLISKDNKITIFMKRSELWNRYYEVIEPYDVLEGRFVYLGEQKCYDKELKMTVNCLDRFFNYKGNVYEVVYEFGNGALIVKLPKEVIN